MAIRPVRWADDAVELLDQTRLPHHHEWIACRGAGQVARAIREMKVRGAPAIGVAAAMGVALAALQSDSQTAEELLAELADAGDRLKSARPTAVNLAWAVDRMLAVAREHARLAPTDMARYLVLEAQLIAREDAEICQAIGKHGEPLVPADANVLTHCNAGALATAAYGTALGVIRSAVAAGKRLHVWVDETRPWLQGARLTTWELAQDEIPHTLIPDNTAGYLMQQGRVDLVVVGADRIAANGDVANKIGTYTLAVLCQAHGIPFYVAAPLSTFDPRLATGAEIPIETRAEREVTHLADVPIAPVGTRAYHAAFDLTPSCLVTAIVTERGVLRPPYQEAIVRLFDLETPAGIGSACGDTYGR